MSHGSWADAYYLRERAYEERLSHPQQPTLARPSIGADLCVPLVGVGGSWAFLPLYGPLQEKKRGFRNAFSLEPHCEKKIWGGRTLN